jgi:hypothetical protein
MHRGEGRIPVPYLEPLVGALWWAVGCLALAPGTNTVVLAAGLGVTGAMITTVRRRQDRSAPLPRGVRSRLLRLGGGTGVLLAGAAAALAATGWDELTVPVTCALVGAALLPLSSVLDERVLLAAGGVLMLVGAAGALLALGSVGRLYPQGMVGLVAGAALWAAGAWRTGVLDELRVRVGR